MVSTRCILAVKNELKNMGLHFIIVDLGQVEILEELTPLEIQNLTNRLFATGLVLMADKKALLVQSMIDAVRTWVNTEDEQSKINFSDYISARVRKDYTSLSTLFSEVRGIKLSQYVLEQKVERIKELLYHKANTITDIAHKMNYSNVSHLCSQFKKVTGLTPGAYYLLKYPLKHSASDKTS